MRNPSKATIKRLKRAGITITCGKCKRNTMRLDQSASSGEGIRLRLYICIVDNCEGRELTELTERRLGQTSLRSLPKGERRKEPRPEVKTA